MGKDASKWREETSKEEEKKKKRRRRRRRRRRREREKERLQAHRLVVDRQLECQTSDVRRQT